MSQPASPLAPAASRPAPARRGPALAAAGLAAALALAALPAAAAAQDAPGDEEYTARRDAQVDARGARRVAVEGRAGTLRVIGVRGLAAVRVRGLARASRRAWLDDIRLEARRDGDAVVVRADIPDRAAWDWADAPGHGTRALDLVVEVPRGIDADVDDGSGAAEISGVGALVVRDGSGALDIADAASVDVRDGSGELRVHDVRGDVRVDDGSGDVTVERVGGAVVVDRDGSGELEVRSVGGDLVVEGRRARGLAYQDVRGRVQVPAGRTRDERLRLRARLTDM